MESNGDKLKYRFDNVVQPIIRLTLCKKYVTFFKKYFVNQNFYMIEKCILLAQSYGIEVFISL